jgi:hypothetical protein
MADVLIGVERGQVSDSGYTAMLLCRPLVACGREASSGLMSTLERIDVSHLSADDAVTVLQQMQRFMSYAAGVESQVRAQVTDIVVIEVQALMDQDADPARPGP